MHTAWQGAVDCLYQWHLLLHTPCFLKRSQNLKEKTILNCFYARSTPLLHTTATDMNKVPDIVSNFAGILWPFSENINFMNAPLLTGRLRSSHYSFGSTKVSWIRPQTNYYIGHNQPPMHLLISFYCLEPPLFYAAIKIDLFNSIANLVARKSCSV